MQPQLLITKAGKNVQRSGGMRLLLAWIAEHEISWFGSDGFAILPSGFVITLPNPQILHSEYALSNKINRSKTTEVEYFRFFIVFLKYFVTYMNLGTGEIFSEGSVETEIFFRTSISLES